MYTILSVFPEVSGAWLSFRHVRPRPDTGSGMTSDHVTRIYGILDEAMDKPQAQTGWITLLDTVPVVLGTPR